MKRNDVFDVDEAAAVMLEDLSREYDVVGAIANVAAARELKCKLATAFAHVLGARTARTALKKAMEDD